MRMPRWVAAAGVVVLLASGCSVAPQPPDLYYRIYAEGIPQSTSPAHLDGILSVRRFLSDGLVGERSLVYGASDHDNPLLQYHYHHWTESPTRMLQEQLVPYLRQARIAEQVVTPDLEVAPDYELIGKIRRMEQLRGDGPSVVVDLEFVLRNPANAELMWLQSYALEVACADESLIAAIDAYNQAVSEIFAQVVHDIRAE